MILHTDVDVGAALQRQNGEFSFVVELVCNTMCNSTLLPADHRGCLHKGNQFSATISGFVTRQSIARVFFCNTFTSGKIRYVCLRAGREGGKKTLIRPIVII